MNDMDVLRRLRDEVPASLPVTSAETALLTAIRAETAAAADVPGGRPAGITRHRFALAAVGALSLALAAVATAVATHGTAPGTHGPLTVRELAYRAAAAASRQASAPADQWVYWREQQGRGSTAHVWNVWTTADGTKAAYRSGGKVYSFDGLPNGRQYVGQPIIGTLRQGGISVTWMYGTIPVSYANLGKLPRAPRALERFLEHLKLPGSTPGPAMAFQAVTELFQTYVMPPHLTASLFRALADIPGVRVDRHARDVAGRPGAGFAFGHGADRQEIILNPRTFLLMGYGVSDGAPAWRFRGFGRIAIMHRELVNGPGVLP